MTALDSDETLLSLLRATSDLYTEQQHAAKNMRKGFLNLAKARQSLGRGTVSALDCREEILPQFTVDEASSAQELEGAEPLWHRHSKIKTKMPSGAKILRRRGGGTAEVDDTASEGSLESCGEESGPTTTADPSQGPHGNVTPQDRNPLLLFGGLAPPALRKSQSDFRSALEHYVTAAGLAHKIALAQSRLAAAQEKTESTEDETAAASTDP
jgi:hypothetical protein